jgi:aminoglycoside phosphotransferase family enzyme
MNGDEVRALAANGTWRGSAIAGSVIETHISWVILAERFAFKIKKPVWFSFLDFSTLERRRYYCNREVELNRRLTDIYLDVLPITRHDGAFVLGGNDSAPLDYAVRMERMDPSLELGHVLADGPVSRTSIEALAEVLAGFHVQAIVVRRPFDVHEMQRNFSDLRSVTEAIGRRLGTDYAAICESAIACSDRFLAGHGRLLRERVADGFRRDVHGDFHAGNVFMSTPPVIFDCIEFNDAMREIDILDEVALLCMDLEARGYRELGDVFMGAWLDRMKLRLSDNERALLRYFKVYRAGVRAKVTALKDGDKRDWQAVARYLDYIRMCLAEHCAPAPGV